MLLDSRLLERPAAAERRDLGLPSGWQRRWPWTEVGGRETGEESWLEARVTPIQAAAFPPVGYRAAAGPLSSGEAGGWVRAKVLGPIWSQNSAKEGRCD